MADPREELVVPLMSNEPGWLPPGHVGEWPRGTPYRVVEPEPSLPPMQGRAPLEPDLSPGGWKPPSTPWQDAQALGGLVKRGFGSFFAGPPAENRQRFEGPYTAPQTAVQGAGAVLGALVDPARRAVESQQTRFDPNADPLTREQAREAGPGAAAEVGMNLAGINAPFVATRSGTAGVFGGRLSKAADLEKQKLAELMEGNGVPANQIWKETGWMRGADKQWRHEIPDLKASYKGDIDNVTKRIFDQRFPDKAGQYEQNPLRMQMAREDALLKTQGKQQLFLADVLDHPELFAAYPELRQMPVTHDAFMQAKGGYRSARGDEPGQIFYRENDPTAKIKRGDTFDTLLHEVQHAIQQIEGFARGSNPSRSFSPGSAADAIYQKQMAQAPGRMDLETFKKAFGDSKDLTQRYSQYSQKRDTEIARFEQQARAYASHEAYRRSAGEAEAVVVPQRKGFTPAQRAAIFPSSQMVPPSKQQIVEFNQPPGGAAQMGGILNPQTQLSAPSPLLRPPGRTMKEENWQPTKPTVLEPRRVFSPEIYRNPRLIAERAAQNVAAEHPALKELFGVTRSDLYDISQQGRRKGNMEPEIFAPKKPGESYVAEGLATPQNEQRILDTLGEGLKHRGLREGMVPWYVMDPMFQQMVKLVGKEQAIKEYQRFNATTAPFSASSDVMTELNRGTAANMYAKRGDYDTFHRFAGADRKNLPPDFPAGLSDVGGHAYHAIQSDPVVRWLQTGKHGYSQQVVKIPTYHAASGVPETGFQTRWPVPDAHFARGVGAADVRDTAKPGVSMKGAEYRSMAPWYREKIAEPLGIEAVPAQALQWGTMSRATGVDTPIGAGKLELLSQRIWERAQKLGIDPKVLRDAVLRGDQHAVGLLTAGVGGAAGLGSLVDPGRYQPEYR